MYIEHSLGPRLWVSNIDYNTISNLEPILILILSHGFVNQLGPSLRAYALVAMCLQLPLLISQSLALEFCPDIAALWYRDCFNYSLTTLVLPFEEGLRRVGQAEGPNWTLFVYADLIVIFLVLVLSVNRMSLSLTDVSHLVSQHQQAGWDFLSWCYKPSENSRWKCSHR